jgi:hypothetical protein
MPPLRPGYLPQKHIIVTVSIAGAPKAGIRSGVKRVHGPDWQKISGTARQLLLILEAGGGVT